MRDRDLSSAARLRSSCARSARESRGRRRRRGRAHVGDEVGDGEVDLVADRAHRRHRAGRERARHHLFVERPQVLEAAAASRHHHHLHPSLLASAGDAAGDFPRRALALHARRHDEHGQVGKAPVQDAQEIVHCRAAGAGHEGDAPRKVRQLALASRVEESLGGELLLELLEGDLQRARPDGLDGVADELVLALRLVDVEVSARDQRLPVARLELETARLVAEEHGSERRVGVLQGEVDVTRAGGAQVGDFAFHQDGLEAPLEDRLDLAGQLSDGIDARPHPLAEEIELPRRGGGFGRQSFRHERTLTARREVNQ
jgi:hypothetical protein